MSQQIGQYRILSELGTGGMGVVYRAMDLLLEREVAIKRLRSEFAASSSVMDRFRKEAQLQAKLNHPNIAQLYTLVQDGESLCIVMELVNGTVLRNFMPLPWQSALPVILQVLEALDYAHRRGVLHRDIKPENIVIDREGTVKVMDFGIAHALGAARMTRERVVIGTLEYMSPERVLNREMDERSDLYSVGILLFETICGRLPFVGESEYELLRNQVEAPPPPVSQFVAGVPEFVEAALRRAMEKDPRNRYASCVEMAAALRAGCETAGWQLQSVAAALHIQGGQEAAQGRRLSTSPDLATLNEVLSEEETALRQTLLRLIASEASGDLDEALTSLRGAMERHPDRTAFRIAEVYLRGAAGGGDRQNGLVRGGGVGPGLNFGAATAIMGAAGGAMRNLCVLLAGLLALPMPPVAAQEPTHKLNLVIVEGDGAINNLRQRTVREPIVQVEDENHKPVAGASVVFLLPSRGAGGTFGNGTHSLTVVTDQQGRAIARGFEPNTVKGQYQIQVSFIL